MLIWRSSVCSCRVECGEVGGPLSVSCCEPDHEIWARKVAEDAFPAMQRRVDDRNQNNQKALRKGYGDSFAAMLERWARLSRNAGVFFRENPAIAVANGNSAELVMYVAETYGLPYLACSNTDRLADYQQGKALLGLMQKMWLEDRASEGPITWPEELVVDGLIGFKEAEQFFGRELRGDLLWLWAENQRLQEELVVTYLGGAE